MLKYPMTVKELRDYLLKKAEKENLIVNKINVDGCFMIIQNLKEKHKEEEYRPENATLVFSNKNPEKYEEVNAKVNMCKYVPIYKKDKTIRNNRYYAKYGERLRDPTFIVGVDIRDLEKKNLDYITKELI